MYKANFNLTRNPFNLTPDPACFVPTKRHNEALSALYHGVRQHKGFVVMTGEVGTGKTLLLRCLLDLLKGSKDVAYSYLFNGRLSPTEFLQYIVADFGLPASGKNKCELLLNLGQFLVSRGSRDMTTALIVDEAHHLSADILEEVRLLSNLESTDDKLLQIVLVGQPELNDKLDSVDLRQLKQRIAVRSHLSPLDADETAAYILQRLKMAGSDSHPGQIFPEDARAEVYRYSQGLPRLINTISENALMTAYARRLSSVTTDVIGYVAKELRLDRVCLPQSRMTEGNEEVNILRAIDYLINLYSGQRRTTASATDMGIPLTIETRKHEPSI